jgi:hypothetical protein
MGEIYSAKDIIGTLFSSLGRDALTASEDTRLLGEAWKKTLLSLKGSTDSPEGGANSYGQRLLSHCRILDVKNGVLITETDHPGWTQLLQIHRAYILAGIQRLVPKEGISALAFRLRSDR